MESIHAHDFMGKVIEANRPLSMEELQEMAKENFGQDPKFHTCSRDGMSVEDLLEFLLKREKIIQKDGGYIINRENVCSH